MFLEDDLDPTLDGVDPIQPVPPMNQVDSPVQSSSSSAGIVVDQPLEDENGTGFLESSLPNSQESANQNTTLDALSFSPLDQQLNSDAEDNSGSVTEPVLVDPPISEGENQVTTILPGEDDSLSESDPVTPELPSPGGEDELNVAPIPGEDDSPSESDPVTPGLPSPGGEDDTSAPALPGEDDDAPNVTDPTSPNPPSSGSEDNPSAPALPGEDDDAPSVTDPASPNPPSPGGGGDTSAPALPGEDDDAPSVADPTSPNPPSSGSEDNPSAPALPGEDDDAPSDLINSQTFSGTDASEVVNVGPGVISVNALGGDDVINLSAINPSQPMLIMGGEGNDQFILDSTYNPISSYSLAINGGAGQDTIDLSRLNDGSFSALFSDGQAAIPLQNLSSSSSPTNIFNISAAQGVIQLNKGGTVTAIAFSGIEKIIV